MFGVSEPSDSGKQSIPYLKSITAHSQANTSATFDEVDPYTVNDMRNNYTAPFDKIFLGLGAVEKNFTVRDRHDAFITGHLRDQPTSLSIEEYGEKRKETALYGPFPNYIISNLDNGKVVFSRNDPNCISELRENPRQPLVVSFDKVSDSIANERWKSFNASGPESVKWTWPDFRLISRFKYPEHTKLNRFEPAVNSELEEGEEWSCKSETKVDPKGSFVGKGARNRFLLDKVGAILGEGCSRERVLGKPYKLRNRVWHCLEYEYPIPLYKVTEISDFKQAVRDTVLGHHLATSHTHILHRDISIRNLMVQVRDGVIRGVLNDWNLGEMKARTKDGRSDKRTGTRPYMAIDLLAPQPPGHLERFDWESFLYVICMIACRYDKGEDINPDVLSEWYEPSYVMLQALKTDVLYHGTTLEIVTDFYQQVLSDWIEPLRELFAVGYEARYQHSRKKPSTPFTGEVPFDNETLGGHVTWEKFWEILQK